MTEEEAKSKWCPFARSPLATAEGTVLAGACVVNRRASGGRDGGCLCLASACMAWRWKFIQTNKAATRGGMWPQPEAIYDRTDEGYCGLAGSAQ